MSDGGKRLSQRESVGQYGLLSVVYLPNVLHWMYPDRLSDGQMDSASDEFRCVEVKVEFTDQGGGCIRGQRLLIANG